MRPKRLDLRLERLDLRPERLYLRPERLDLRPERLDLRPERPDLRPERLEKLRRGGRVDKQTDGRMDGHTDVWKFTPVSYRTSALWGRCPKSRKSVRWSAVPVAPKLVYVTCEGERGSGPEGADGLCLARILVLR